MNRLYVVMWKFAGDKDWGVSYCLVYDDAHHDSFGLDEDNDVALLINSTGIRSVEELEANFEHYLRENNHDDIVLRRFDFITSK